jgi:hypothetical protein
MNTAPVPSPLKQSLLALAQSIGSSLRNELIIASIALTVVGTLTVLPRPTYPQVLPLPSVDQVALSSREAEELTRAHAASDGSLDKEVRAVGEQIRRIGTELSWGRAVNSERIGQLQRDVARLLARKGSDELLPGQEGLLRLRALQAQMFLSAAHNWATSGDLTTELRELGGSFHQVASQAWRGENGQFKLTDDELRLFFRIHFGRLAGLHNKHPFGPSLEELRRYYSANLRHPAGLAGDVGVQSAAQISFVRALGKVDPDYPASLAEGILRLRLGQPELALQNLTNHVDAHPDGPWFHLARNHRLLAAQLSQAIDEAGH